MTNPTEAKVKEIKDYDAVVIVCGPRDFNNAKYIELCLKGWLRDKTPNLLFITGECPTGADYHAKNIVKKLGYDYDDSHKADWDKYCKPAGPICNSGMAKVGDYCLAFWGGISKGSGSHDMIEKAAFEGLEVTIFPTKPKRFDR